MADLKDYIVPCTIEFYAKVKGDTKAHAEKSFAKSIMRHKIEIQNFVKKLYDEDLEVKADDDRK